ncbi:MAG TPA: serine/threonine-protein kinase, partial [Xanthomonadales bacterium]|nr:serine/threonine-protein kinase [Xanthomonadales bacterium]
MTPVEFPGYTIERMLGKGGMATVYLARQHSLGRSVALKVLSPALAHDPEATGRFLREARIAASLRHPNIVAVHDVGTHEGLPYMAIAYEPAGSVAPLAPMDPARTLAVVRDIALALDHAHQRGVVHRDVKPENILVGEHGSYVLSDFGIALALGTATPLTAEGGSVGTPQYMSPEQLRGGTVDGRSDLYGLGGVMYRLLTGQFPFAGDDGWAIGMQHLSAPVPRLPSALAHLQPLLDAMMAKDPADRPQTGADVARRVDALRGEATSPVPSVATTPVPQLARRSQARRWIVVAAVLAAIAFATSAWLLTRRAPEVAVAPAPAPKAVVATKPAIAVLPFADMSEAHDQGAFAEGISEELIHLLAQVQGLDVASRTSSFAFQGGHESVEQIGAKLKVTHVLEGSVRKAGDRIRVTVQLIKVSDGFHVWSKIFDEQVADVFAVQDSIGAAVVAALRIDLVPGFSPSSLPRMDLPASAPSGDYRRA